MDRVRHDRTAREFAEQGGTGTAGRAAAGRVTAGRVAALDDAGIVERSIRNPELFSVIFNRHAPTIHRYLARRLDRDTADDLVGEVFLVAFRRRERYDCARSSALPWLYGIATNLIGQSRRDEARSYRLLARLAPEPDEDCHAERVAAIVAAGAVRGLLLAALGRLTPGDRDVLLLIAWEGLTYDEVASALDIPVGTVRSRLNRARRKVRAELGDSNPSTMFEETIDHG